MRLETERLVLRELTNDDLAAWYAILSDAETMKHYPAPFDEEKVRQWLEWNLENYQNYGFGLWAVILKEENRLIGDCGMAMQCVHGKMLPAITFIGVTSAGAMLPKRRAAVCSMPLRTCSSRKSIPI